MAIITRILLIVISILNIMQLMPFCIGSPPNKNNGVIVFPDENLLPKLSERLSTGNSLSSNYSLFSLAQACN